jgi:maltodextrin utilization protein YvdJ
MGPTYIENVKKKIKIHQMSTFAKYVSCPSDTGMYLATIALGFYIFDIYVIYMVNYILSILIFFNINFSTSRQNFTYVHN